MKKNLKLFFAIALMLLMLPAFNLIAFANEKTKEAPNKKVEKNTKDIVDIATGDGRFKTPTAALQAAGLVDVLKGEGPFTVFAPTDEAFGKIPAEALSNLLKPENKDLLVNILKYHVAPGKLTSADIVKLDGKELAMGNGKKAKIKVINNEVFIDNARVIVKDIMAKNGIIRVIDAVILPQ